MLESLRFVQGAVARKDLVPALTHFRIENGHVRGFNGAIALSSPIALDLTCSPLATQFIKAIVTCDETVKMHMADNGKLILNSGGFTVYIECTEDQFPNIYPEGQEVPLEKNFLETVVKLQPFIAEDASRPWARGIMFRNRSAFATNNVVLLECWLSLPFPFEINVSKETVAELVRIGVNPVKMQVSENSVTFHYEDGRWLRSQLLSTQWPELATILDISQPMKPFPESFFKAVEKLIPFTDDLNRLHFKDGVMSTSLADGVGARVTSIQGLPTSGCYNIQQVLALQGVAESINFSAYPAPCLFYGDNIRGVIIGLRP